LAVASTPASHGLKLRSAIEDKVAVLLVGAKWVPEELVYASPKPWDFELATLPMEDVSLALA
jgi:hypothetical protein